eukprot:5270484-Lingulodinium_polyedra.AAC.2
MRGRLALSRVGVVIARIAFGWLGLMVFPRRRPLSLNRYHACACSHLFSRALAYQVRNALASAFQTLHLINQQAGSTMHDGGGPH